MFGWGINTNVGTRDPIGIDGRGPTRGSVEPPQDNDCQRFANMVEAIANNAQNARDFMDTMVREFIGLTEATSSQFDSPAIAMPNTTIGDQGFKSNLRDETNLQVRHFTGGLLAGYLYGSAAGTMGMNSREDGPFGRGAVSTGAGVLSWLLPANAEARADIILNGISAPLGANLHPTDAIYSGKTGQVTTPANLGYKGLANAIRRRICE
jgi:hypothetical protein